MRYEINLSGHQFDLFFRQGPRNSLLSKCGLGR